MKGKVLIIESSDIGIRYTAQALQEMGYEPVFLCDISHLNGDPRRQIAEFMAINCDTSSSASVIKAIKKSGMNMPVAVFTTADTRLKVTTEIATELDIPGIDPAILRLKSKAMVSKLIPEFGPPFVEFRMPDVPKPEIAKLFSSGKQVIVKPTHGAGGLGAFCLKQPDEIDGLAERIAAIDVPAEMEKDSWIAQTFINGRLVSAEGFVLRGNVSVVGFTGRTKIGATESTATFPIDHTIPESVRTKAIDAIKALVQRSEFQYGYFHNEFMVTDDDCFLIDANMGRIGGGAIAEQLAISYGLDPVDVYKHILEVTLFPSSNCDEIFYKKRDRRETHAIFYGLERGGVVTDVKLPSSMNCYHTLIAGPGTKVSPMGENDWAWVGILSGFTRYTTHIIRQIRICTTEGEFPPAY